MIVSPSGAKRAADTAPVRNVSGVNSGIDADPPPPLREDASIHIVTPPTAAPAVSTETSAVRKYRMVLLFAWAMSRWVVLSSLIHRNAAVKSAALCQRSSGSLARHFFTT